MFPVFTFAYNFEVSLIPVHSSFAKADRTGITGIKSTIYTLILASFYYMIVLLIPPILKIDSSKFITL
jgi:hypothetical protein